MRTIVASFAVLAALAGAAPVSAQQVEISVPAPERHREFGIIPPGDQYEATRPSDDYYPPPGERVRYDPAFIAPLSDRIESGKGTGRVGVAGWTSPNPPVGSTQTGYNEVSGWFALGFALEWGGPLPPGRRPATSGAPAQRSPGR